MSLPTHPVPDPHTDPLVASVLRADERAAAGACPDADLLAMYVERELGGGEQAEIETHVHGCARCQAMVAALVRALPDAPVGPSTAVEASGSGGFAAWFAGWRWLIPAASLTAVAVVAVWVGRGPADQVAELRRMEGRVAEGDNFVRPRPTLPGESAPVGPQNRPAGPTAPAAPVAPLGAGIEARDDGAPAAKTLERAYRGRQAAPVEAPTAPPAAEAQETLTAAADVRTETSGLVGGRAARADGAASSARPAAPAAAAAADPLFRANLTPSSWRVSRGVVERSRDGVAWELVAAPAGLTVIAVASVSADVCWAITTDAVITTNDGATWTRVSRPSAGTLTSVSATSARAAAVTVGGTRFVTTDGGATWAPAQ